MNEGAPKSFKPAVEKGILEGNIAMPQTGVGIKIMGAEKLMSQPDPKQAIDDLLAPIPLDDPALVKRLKIAEAMHVKYDIKKSVNVERMRLLDVQSILATIFFIADILDIEVDEDRTRVESFDESGNWVTPEVKAVASELKEKLTPEMISFIRQAFKELVLLFKSQESAESLQNRKEKFRNWSENNKRSFFSSESDALQDLANISYKVSNQLMLLYKNKDISHDQMRIINKISMRLF